MGVIYGTRRAETANLAGSTLTRSRKLNPAGRALGRAKPRQKLSCGRAAVDSDQGGPPISTMAPAGYQRVPTNLSTTQRRVAARNNPVPLAVRLVLGGAALGAVLYWWPVLDGSYRFLLFVFAIIMWAQFTTGAWSQNAREYRRHTDQLQNNEMKRAWGIFKEAAVGKTAIPINALDRVHARRSGGASQIAARA